MGQSRNGSSRSRYPERLAEVAFKAIRISTNGTPGPVVIAIPEDVQQQVEARPSWEAVRTAPTLPLQTTVAQIAQLLSDAERPLIIAGGALDTPDGRGSLRRIAEQYGVPVVVSFRQHDLFPHDHPLYAGDLGLANPAEQIAMFATSDLIVALGTRLGDITTQGYRFPIHPKPAQILIHCYPDDRVIGAHFSADIGIVCDPAVLADSGRRVRPRRPRLEASALGRQRAGHRRTPRSVAAAEHA